MPNLCKECSNDVGEGRYVRVSSLRSPHVLHISVNVSTDLRARTPVCLTARRPT